MEKKLGEIKRRNCDKYVKGGHWRGRYREIGEIIRLGRPSSYTITGYWKGGNITCISGVYQR